MSKRRFVLDSNIIVSAALLDTSPARQAFETALLHGEILLILHPFRDIAILTPQAFWFYLSASN